MNRLETMFFDGFDIYQFNWIPSHGTSDFKSQCLYEYSLIGSSVPVVIFRCYFRNRGEDLNPDVHDFQDHNHYSMRQTYKKPANRLKLRPQYIDFSFLNPVLKMRIYPGNLPCDHRLCN
jgi:hypothetical protein